MITMIIMIIMIIISIYAMGVADFQVYMSHEKL